MGFYDGVLEFKKWKRTLPRDPGFDWADLTDSERRMWARYQNDLERTLDNQEEA